MMKKIVFVLCMLLFTACGTGNKQQVSSAADIKQETAPAPAASQEQEEDVPSVELNPGPSSIIVKGIPVKTKELKVEEPCSILVEYPVFDQPKIDATVEAWAKAHMENDVQYIGSFMEDGFTPDVEMPPIHLFVNPIVLEYSADKGASILFAEGGYLGGAHGTFTFSTLSLDAEGNEIDPMRVFASPEDGAKRLSDECRRQFLKNGLSPDTFMPGTEPDPINFRWLLRRGDELLVFYPPYEVASWAEGPQLCIYPLSQK